MRWQSAKSGSGVTLRLLKRWGGLGVATINLNRRGARRHQVSSLPLITHCSIKIRSLKVPISKKKKKFPFAWGLLRKVQGPPANNNNNNRESGCKMASPGWLASSESQVNPYPEKWLYNPSVGGAVPRAGQDSSTAPPRAPGNKRAWSPPGAAGTRPDTKPTQR